MSAQTLARHYTIVPYSAGACRPYKWEVLKDGNEVSAHGTRAEAEGAIVLYAKADASAEGEVPSMREALTEALDFLEGQEDAEYLPGKSSPTPNEAMRVCMAIRAALEPTPAMPRHERAKTALKNMAGILRRIQDTLANHLTPDGDEDPHEAINAVLEIADNKETIAHMIEALSLSA